MPTYTFIGDCVALGGDEINAMRDHATQREVTYRTFRSHCAALDTWARERGYAPRSNVDHGLTLKGDWHVGYYRSVFNGAPCYYLTWSAFEHVWALE